jgi:hypothetical protein
MATLKTILAVVGAIETVVLIVGLSYGAVLWARGIFPALLRLGNGLASRRIAIFAGAENGASLKRLLLDSKLFSEKNILEISRVEDVGVSERATVYLVFWHDWANQINEILRRKPDGCALVVYAPRDQGPIPENLMKELDGHRHTAVTNFRGRLLNDIVTAMITTSYEQR